MDAKHISVKRSRFWKSLLVASILGAISPAALSALSSVNTTALSGDMQRVMNMSLEAAYCLGAILSIPGLLAFYGLLTIISAVHEQGNTVPLFDLLPAQAQGLIMFAISVVCNVGAWLVPVSIFRWFLGDNENRKDKAHSPL